MLHISMQTCWPYVRGLLHVSYGQHVEPQKDSWRRRSDLFDLFDRIYNIHS